MLGGGREAGNKGYADVLMHKRLMQDYLSGGVTRGRRFVQALVDHAKTHLGSHKAFRKSAAGYPESEAVGAAVGRSW